MLLALQNNAAEQRRLSHGENLATPPKIACFWEAYHATVCSVAKILLKITTLEP
jgi:hypothetical protein